MSKTKTANVTTKHVTPQLLKIVEGVIGEAATHTYSVSRVYAAYNGALQKNDKPQSCSSCLRNRVRELKAWYAAYKKQKGEAVDTTEETGTQFQTANQGADKPLMVFTPEEEGAQYGIATGGDGLPLPAGNYHHAGEQYAVSGEQGHYTVITGEPAGDEAFKAAHIAKLNELGVTEDSTNEELLEALEVLSTAEGVTEDEAAFYAGEIEKVTALIADAQHQVTTDGALRLAEEGAQGIKFTPNEGETVKGLVEWADGTKVKPGKYPLADGRELAVQVGGKATIKEEDLT